MSCFTEYDEAKVHGWFKEEGRQEGLKEGLKEGETFGVIRILLKQEASSERIISELVSEFGISEDEAKAKLREYKE